MSSKVFIVTGASRGLGLAVAQTLLRDSHKVFLVARTEKDMKTLKEQHPSSVDFITADLADFTTAPKVIQSSLQAFGRIDGLVVNHAMMGSIAKISESSPEDWNRTYNINLFSAVGLVKEAIPELRKTNGRVVFVSSGAALGAYAGWGAYGTSKAAINHLCAHLSVEEPSITSVAISPGKVDTAMQKYIREEGEVGMAADIYAGLVNEHEKGILLPPEKPGSVIAKLVAGAKKEFSGKHFRWNAAELADFQS